MARVGDQDLVAVVDPRLDVIVEGGVFGEGGQNIERRQRPGSGLDPRRFGRDRGPQAVEGLDLPLEDPLVGAEDFLLVLLQRRGDEALAAGNRLLANVVGGRRMQVRFRDFDEVAEDAVVANLQRADAGPLALGGFHLSDDLLAGSADGAKLIELRVDAVPQVAAVPREGGRLVDERRLNRRAHIHDVVQLRDQRRHQGRLEFAEQRSQARHRHQRLLQTHQIARPRGPERSSGDQPLEILHRLEGVAEFAALGVPERDLLHGVEAIANRLERDQRAEEPGAQEPAADRRDRPIELVEQRSVPATFRPLEDLEVLHRRGIDQQRVGALPVADRADVSEVDHLGVAQIVDERACGGDGGRVLVESESLESTGAELIEQHATGRLGFERPAIDQGGRQTGFGDG